MPHHAHTTSSQRLSAALLASAVAAGLLVAATIEHRPAERAAAAGPQFLHAPSAADMDFAHGAFEPFRDRPDARAAGRF